MVDPRTVPSVDNDSCKVFGGNGRINNSAENEGNELRPRTYSLGEEGVCSQKRGNHMICSNGRGKPATQRNTHASAAGSAGILVVGTSNDNFRKGANPLPAVPSAKHSPPQTSIVLAPTAASRIKQRRFRVESSDR